MYELKSHKNSISDLKFSPWDNSYPTLPIVLASCSEKLCFWDISYAINNKIKHKNLNTKSSRYYSPSKIDKSTETFRYPDPSAKPPDSNLWNRKKGISSKPELFACIVFNGNHVEKLCCNDSFTRFNTIDDNGGYYDFQVQQIASSESWQRLSKKIQNTVFKHKFINLLSCMFLYLLYKSLLQSLC